MLDLKTHAPSCDGDGDVLRAHTGDAMRRELERLYRVTDRSTPYNVRLIMSILYTNDGYT